MGLRVVFPGWSVGWGEVIHRVHLRREKQDGRGHGIGEGMSEKGKTNRGRWIYKRG